MNVYIYPDPTEYQQLIQRPTLKSVDLAQTVEEIFDAVQREGDQAVSRYTTLYDQVDLQSFVVTKEEIKRAKKIISKDLIRAIHIAKANIEKFHRAQKEKVQIIETTTGVYCWRESRPIEKVGIYIPGGTAPLFSTVLMLCIPAKLAGCGEIILCTPPNSKGDIHPAILYCASLVGIKTIYKVGGIQAIAAMTFGTNSIPRVDKIFGPGNQYVTAAKQAAQQLGVAIDMPAGPSEVLIIADQSADPQFIAADLLSQAEHGPDSQVILLSDDKTIIDRTMNELTNQLNQLPRKDVAQSALTKSSAIVLKNIPTCVAFSNVYAPEHLILATKNPKKWIPLIQHAGSVFLGNYSCESAGDYASGTNHTLPTNGYARQYSGVSLDSFVKKITFQNLTKKGIINIGPTVEIMAEAEQLMAHKNAVTIRINKLISKT